MKRPFSDVIEEIENLRCARCGKKYYGDGCIHTHTAVDDMTDEEAKRVQARYALGKLHNPDHDTANYRD
jgi:hypothetical protein